MGDEVGDVDFLDRVRTFDWGGFAGAVHALAVEKGWWDGLDVGDADVIASKMELIHTELSEMAECVRDAHFDTTYAEDRYGNLKPEGFIIEAADVCIRALDLLAAFGAASYVAEEFAALPDPGVQEYYRDQPVIALSTVLAIRDAFHREVAAKDPDNALIGLIASVVGLGRVFGGNVIDAMEEKHAFNKTRKHRHGGRLA